MTLEKRLEEAERDATRMAVVNKELTEDRGMDMAASKGMGDATVLFSDRLTSFASCILGANASPDAGGSFTALRPQITAALTAALRCAFEACATQSLLVRTHARVRATAVVSMCSMLFDDAYLERSFFPSVENVQHVVAGLKSAVATINGDGISMTEDDESMGILIASALIILFHSSYHAMGGSDVVAIRTDLAILLFRTNLRRVVRDPTDLFASAFDVLRAIIPVACNYMPYTTDKWHDTHRPFMKRLNVGLKVCVTKSARFTLSKSSGVLYSDLFPTTDAISRNAEAVLHDAGVKGVRASVTALGGSVDDFGSIASADGLIKSSRCIFTSLFLMHRAAPTFGVSIMRNISGAMGHGGVAVFVTFVDAIATMFSLLGQHIMQHYLQKTKDWDKRKAVKRAVYRKADASADDGAAQTLKLDMKLLAELQEHDSATFSIQRLSDKRVLMWTGRHGIIADSINCVTRMFSVTYMNTVEDSEEGLRPRKERTHFLGQNRDGSVIQCYKPSTNVIYSSSTDGKSTRTFTMSRQHPPIVLNMLHHEVNASCRTEEDVPTLSIIPNTDCVEFYTHALRRGRKGPLSRETEAYMNRFIDLDALRNDDGCEPPSFDDCVRMLFRHQRFTPSTGIAWHPTIGTSAADILSAEVQSPRCAGGCGSATPAAPTASASTSASASPP